MLQFMSFLIWNLPFTNAHLAIVKLVRTLFQKVDFSVLKKYLFSDYQSSAYFKQDNSKAKGEYKNQPVMPSSREKSLVTLNIFKI